MSRTNAKFLIKVALWVVLWLWIGAAVDNYGVPWVKRAFDGTAVVVAIATFWIVLFRLVQGGFHDE